MRHTVACRVAVFIFGRVLAYALNLVRHGTLDIVFGRLVVHHELDTLDVSLEIVAGVLHVRAHAEVLRCLRLRQPVLSLDVVALLLFCPESRSEERDARLVVLEFMRYGHGTEIGAEEVLLLTVEINAETAHVLERSEPCLAVLGFEIIVVLRYVSDEVDLPVCLWPPAEICLIVKEIRPVLTLRLQRSEQIAVRLVAQSVRPGELFCCQSQIAAGSEERGCDAPFGLLWPFVCDVECRAHLVAVFGLEAAGRESNLVYHIGVDDAQSLLLSAAYEERPEHLYIVDIHRVFVERSATDVVLARQLRVG